MRLIWSDFEGSKHRREFVSLEGLCDVLKVLLVLDRMKRFERRFLL